MSDYSDADSQYDTSSSDGEVIIDEDETKNAALQANYRKSAISTTAGGDYRAMRSRDDIAKLGPTKAWELINPCGVHPKDATKPIFEYDLLAPSEPKPWREKGANKDDWFNYGFDEETWDVYRKEMLKIYEDQRYKKRISALTDL